MGYYTYFKMSWRPYEGFKNTPNCEHDPTTKFCPICGKEKGITSLDDIVAEYIKNHQDMSYAVNTFGNCQNQSKWYDYKEDMIEMSKKIPNVLFELEGEGEENGDIWEAQFLNGKAQNHRATLEIPPFDPNKWEWDGK